MVSTICEFIFQVLRVILTSVSALSSMDSRLRGNDGGGAGTHAAVQGWIPAFAESAPRIEQKSSGGNDGGGGKDKGRRNDGGHGAVGSCTSGATMHVEVMPCSWSW